MSVRDFAARITELGYPVSYGSVNAYEKVETAGKIPAEYLAVIAREFKKSPAWLLLDEGPEEMTDPAEAIQRLEAMRKVLDMPAHL